MRSFWALLLCGCAIAAAPSGAHAVSFDCNEADSAVELRICTDVELRQLDDDLAAAYAAAGRPKTDQRRWLDKRNACKHRDCIKDAYVARIAELRGEPIPGKSATEMRAKAQEACKDQQGIGWQWCMGRQMCAQMDDPRSCDDLRARAADEERQRFAAAFRKARACAEGKEGSARRECFQEMCNDSPNLASLPFGGKTSAECAARADKFERGEARRKVAYEACHHLRGDAARQCFGKYGVRLTEPVRE